MSLDNIFNKINQDAKKDIVEIEKKAQEEIVAFNDEMSKKNSVIQGKLNKKLEKERRAYIDNMKGEINSKMKNSILEKKQELLDGFYTKVLKKMTELSNDNYLQFLVSLLEKLPKVNDGQVLCSGKNKDIVKKALSKSKQSYKLSNEIINNAGGFILKAKDIEIDNTLETIVKKLQEDTVIEVGKILFEK